MGLDPDQNFQNWICTSGSEKMEWVRSATLVYTLFVGESLPSIQLHFRPSPLLTDLPPRPPLLHQ